MTISARYVRRARKMHLCECGARIEAGHGYLRLYGHAEDGTPPFGVCFCDTCIKTDLLPAIEQQRGYAWKDTKMRAALVGRTVDRSAPPVQPSAGRAGGGEGRRG